MRKKIIVFVFALSFLLPTLVFGSFDVSLKYGSRGDAVIELQDFLQDQGVYSGKADGKFGLGTRKAVVAFQLANNLKGDGYFGLGSRTKANSLLMLELKPSLDAEKAEIGTTTLPTTDNNGCTTTSVFSITTGQLCNKIVPPVPYVVSTIPTPVVTTPETPIPPAQNVPIPTPPITPVVPAPFIITPIVPTAPITLAPTPIPPTNPVITYSDYNFDYEWGYASPNPSIYSPSNAQSNAWLSCPATFRTIQLKKVVFKISSQDAERLQQIESKKDSNHQYSFSAKLTIAYNTSNGKRTSETFVFEKKDANTFVFMGNTPPVCGDGTIVAIYISTALYPINIPDEQPTYFFPSVTPQMSEWEVWDTTTSKPVKVN